MGRGPGPTLSAQFSFKPAYLSGTNMTTDTQSFAIFGYASTINDISNDVILIPEFNIFNGNTDLSRTVNTYTINDRTFASEANINCGNSSFALFAGGIKPIPNDPNDAELVNDVDIFICNDSGVNYHKTIKDVPTNLIGFNNNVNVTCGNDKYVIYNSGQSYLTGFFTSGEGTLIQSNDIYLFKCENDDVFYDGAKTWSGQAKVATAIAALPCNDSKTYIAIACGTTGNDFSSPGTNDISIFECNDLGINFKETIEFQGAPRAFQTGATLRNYALFIGGSVNDSGDIGFTNDVVVYECNDQGILYNKTFEISRTGIFQTIGYINCNNDSYALLFGGFDPNAPLLNDEILKSVDIIKCNDSGVFYDGTTKMNLPRIYAKSATVTIDGKEWLLAGGGNVNIDGPIIGPNAEKIDIYDCETKTFLPLN